MTAWRLVHRNQGTVTIEPTSGLMVTGNGSSSVALTGSTPDLNAALAALVYRGGLNLAARTR